MNHRGTPRRGPVRYIVLMKDLRRWLEANDTTPVQITPRKLGCEILGGLREPPIARRDRAGTKKGT